MSTYNMSIYMALKYKGMNQIEVKGEENQIKNLKLWGKVISLQVRHWFTVLHHHIDMTLIHEEKIHNVYYLRNDDRS